MVARPVPTLPDDPRALLETLAIDLAAADPGATLLPTLAISTGQFEAIEDDLASRDEVVLLDQTLGEGGMGVVKAGTQTSLDRSVAVKAIRPEKADPRTTVKLIQEARVTSFLEHPNIVPIYDLARDEGGLPLLVMRRIVGSPWSALLKDDDAVRARFGVADPLDWHLRTLMQIASALEYAHDKDIIHLDLKPDNVMIGPLGEVYLVDWGLAMSLRPDPRLPQASRMNEIIGTPAFIAPEMLTGDGTLLGRHTDVYLLGATLYRLLAGRPPHHGDNMLALLYRVCEGAPDPLPEAIPKELADIVGRAMARQPRDRFASAEGVRLALQDFLQHRGALQLVEQADRRAAELDRLLAAELVDGVVAAASEARFGYSQALAAWPESVAAQAGLDRVTEQYALWCARRGQLDTAEGLAKQLSTRSEALDAALWAERERQAEAAERLRGLESLGADLDARTGQRIRLAVAGGGVAVAAGLPIAGLLIEGLASYTSVLAFPIGFLALIALGIAARPKALSATRLNRAGMGTLIAMSLAQLAVTWMGYQAGVDLDVTMAMVFPVWTLAAVLFVMTLAAPLWPSAVAYVMGCGVVVVWPETWLAGSSLCNAVVLVNLLWVWRPGGTGESA